MRFFLAAQHEKAAIQMRNFLHLLRKCHITASANRSGIIQCKPVIDALAQQRIQGSHKRSDISPGVKNKTLASAQNSLLLFRLRIPVCSRRACPPAWCGWVRRGCARLSG